MKRVVVPILVGSCVAILLLAFMVAYTIGTGENQLAAQYTTTPPVVDGDASDAVWANAPELTLKNGARMKAVYTNDELFILAQWDDSTFSATRGGSWSWVDGAWAKSSNIEEGAYNEDRFCVLWNINITNFASQGCLTKCHGPQGDATGAWLENVGERGDMWHMKAARALGAISGEQSGALVIDDHEAIAGAITLNGYTDDKVVAAKDDPDFPFDPEDGGRHGDKFGDSQAMFYHNRNADKTAPLYIETAPENYIDAMIIHQAEVDGGEAVEVAGLSDAQIAEYWAIYEGFGAIVPERVLKPPAGSRGDVRQSATWSDGVWVSEYQRALVTGYGDDVQFDNLAEPYYFATTIMDNSGGENHDLRDMLETLVFEDFVPIVELPEVPGYVGSERCALCHSEIASKWVETPHANYVREGIAENVIGDFSQVLTLSGSGVPPVTVELGIEDGVYTAKVGDATYPVDLVFGGIGWKQRYLTKIGNSMYILPIQWNIATQEWVPYHLGDWYDSSGAAKRIAKRQSWDRRCAGCHATGNMPVETEEGEFIANFIEDSIGCEACHGPGKEHASTGNAALIVNPGKMEDFDRKNDVCGQCHLRGTSNGGTYGYAYDEVANRNFQPGDDLEALFVDGGGYWPDGQSVKHHQQWLDWKQSEHGKSVSCIDCHDVHGTSLPASLKADPDSNELCISCHTWDEDAVAKHTKHSVDPTGSGSSRCIECHMPFTAKSAVPYDIRSHTFKFLSPQHGIENNMPDSCTNCHNGSVPGAVAMTQDQAAAAYTVLFGEPEPETPETDYTNVFFVSLSPGLNMISVPLEPITPYTARSFAEQISSTVVIKYDEAIGKFVGFALNSPGDGFDIEGGKGYIVNVPAGGTAAFTGTAWTNELPVEAAAPPVVSTDKAWAFLVSGRVLDGDGMSASSGDYTIIVNNPGAGATATEKVDESGYFSAAWADLNRKAVIEAGDKIEVVVMDGSGEIVSGPHLYEVTLDRIRDAVVDVRLTLGDIRPANSALLQNYPNPFNPETWMPYHLEQASSVSIRIYDAVGNLVRMLDLGHKNPGVYTARSSAAYWDGKNEMGERVASGIYFYNITAGSFSATRKMVIAQ